MFLVSVSEALKNSIVCEGLNLTWLGVSASLREKDERSTP